VKISKENNYIKIELSKENVEHLLKAHTDPIETVAMVFDSINNIYVVSTSWYVSDSVEKDVNV
jgi:hypothetical protein